MKTSSKVLAATAIATGSALGILFAPAKGSESRKKLNKQLGKLARLLNGECSKEKLLMAKGKLEQHKLRIEQHLQKINTKLAAQDV